MKKAISCSIFLICFWLLYIGQMRLTNIVATKPSGEVVTDLSTTLLSQSNRVLGGNWVFDFQFMRPRFLLGFNSLNAGCIVTLLINEQTLKADTGHCLSSEQISQHIELSSNVTGEVNSGTISGYNQKGSFGFLLMPDIYDPSVLFLFLLFTISFGYLVSQYLLEFGTAASKYIGLVFALGAFIRAWAIFCAHPLEGFLISDMNMYFTRADQLMAGIYNSKLFFQPIGYSLFSAALRVLDNGQWFYVKLAHLMLSIATLWFSWRASEILFGRVVARVSLLLLAIAPPLWTLATFHLAETLYTFLIALLFYFIVRNSNQGHWRFAAGSGLSFALGFFVKGTLSFFFPVYLLWNFWTQPKNIRLRNSLIIASSALMIALLHGYASYQMIGKFKLGADAGGLNFIEGKCPSKHNFAPDGESWLSPLFGYLKETQKKTWSRPFTDQSFYWQEGLKCISENPSVLLSSARYVYYLFWGNPLWPASYSVFGPAEQLWEWFFALFLGPLFFVCLLQIALSPKRPEFALVLMSLGLFLTVYIFKSEYRFRVPFDVFIIPMALHALFLLWQKVKIVLVARKNQ